MMNTEEIDKEVLKQAKDILSLLEAQKSHGRTPTPQSCVHIKADKLSYSIEANIDTLKNFIKRYEAKDQAPAETLLPGGKKIKKEMKNLPRFDKSQFSDWELCKTETEESQALGGLF